jgi:hypothetical protein
MQSGTQTEARRFPRVRLEVDVSLSFPQGGLVPGRTLDLSEAGMSAVLPVALLIGEIVRLEIKFPLEPVRVTAIVRNRNAFRYGFEFDQPGTGRELLKKVVSLP